MKVSNPLSRRGFIRGSLQVLGAASVAANAIPAYAARASAAKIDAIELTPKDKGGLVLLQGAGCNVVAMRGPDGALMIDGGLAENSAALVKAATSATGTRRVNTLFNTHWHPEQTGSN